jgi:hypothetical protein
VSEEVDDDESAIAERSDGKVGSSAAVTVTMIMAMIGDDGDEEQQCICRWRAFAFAG